MSHHDRHNHSNHKKITGIIVGLGAFILLIAAGLALSYRPPTATNQSPAAAGPVVLAAEVMAYDFGPVSMANGKVSKVFTIKNSTDNAATIQKLYTSCMCTEATLLQNGQRIGPFGMPGHGPIPTIAQPLNAGESAEVEVVFDPAAHGPAGVGPIQRDIYVETVGGGRLVLQIKAQVTP